MEGWKMSVPPIGKLLLAGLAGYTATSLLSGRDQTVRRVFFSFHYQRDIWRVNQVRNHWIAKDDRQAAGYFDGSLWEAAQTLGKARVKRIIDDGLTGSSVTCVLIGAETYTRHWVDYEIFRSIELGKGVFGVRIHGLKNRDGVTDSWGANPFDFLGYGTDQRYPDMMVPYAKYREGWKVYEEADPISPGAAPYLQPNSKPILSSLFRVYDWVADNGYLNFPEWVRAAAQQAGR
jgi:hypothetical protein